MASAGCECFIQFVDVTHIMSTSSNQLHAMPVFGDLFTKLIGRGHKQLGDCAFYLRFIYLDERGVLVEEE